MDFVGIGMQIVLLIVGFVLLIKGSDFFVDGSSNIASILKIPTLIVGLTIVAFGTSAPEAAVSITSSLTGNNALAVSNIIGSNLFNMMLIVGLCALLNELKIGRDVIKIDLPFLVIITAILSAIIFIGWNISQIEGIILLIIIIGYVSFLVYKMSETLVGLTIVAMGTSLPELVTSLTALKKDENQLVIGNVIGSCIFNILFVLGASSAISPIAINPNMVVDIMLMLVVTILFYIFGKTQDKYDKKEGAILVGLFIIYMAFAILRN